MDSRITDTLVNSDCRVIEFTQYAPYPQSYAKQYQVTVTTTGTLTVTMDSAFPDPALALVNSLGAVINSAAFFNAKPLVVSVLSPGTYYVLASSSASELGAFSLTARFRTPADCSSTLLAPTGSTTTLTDALAATDCRVVEILPSSSSSHYPQSFAKQYRINVATKGILTATMDSAFPDRALLLVNSLGAVIGFAAFFNSLPEIVSVLDPGTYFILVTSSASELGNFSLNTRFTGSVSAPVSTITAVANAGSGQSVVAPNTWVSIYGSNFAPPGYVNDWSKSVVGGKLPTTLDGVTVTIGGQLAYISFINSTQINVLTPDLGSGSVSVAVTTSAGTSQPFSVTSQRYSPACFPWPNGQPVATHVDYTPAAKTGTFQSIPSVPARPGETIVLWCTGFGATTPSIPLGVQIPVTPVFYTSDPVTVLLGGTPGQVYAVALASGLAGVYQVAVTIPATLANGDYALVATINGAQTPANLTLTVHN